MNSEARSLSLRSECTDLPRLCGIPSFPASFPAPEHDCCCCNPSRLRYISDHNRPVLSLALTLEM
ncbi:hypothetical protein EI94DRAFT_1743730 [Lactarius quietus]|nr:hypothetical protein EI94DRAFT_1743730 [Lactarius quietus]